MQNQDPTMAVMEANTEPRERELRGGGAVRLEISVGHAWLVHCPPLYIAPGIALPTSADPQKSKWRCLASLQDHWERKVIRQRKQPMQRLKCSVIRKWQVVVVT